MIKFYLLCPSENCCPLVESPKSATRDMNTSVPSNAVVYRKPKYTAETEYFYYSAFGFGRRNFILDIRPLVLS
jgi:hypothetical protein